ncbi:lysis protein [Kosakonia cowanii]|uniref:lysis protein n=1 Tax=Kosakonia cowanii TaxID=208223 RepID=UPI0027305C4D|nr:lysis protein [Kosakonia cowanii]WKW43365.1 lysis protein [Kosakonia cowanii]WKW43417.1 lysis protein [Kosakonia cowanii]
MNRFITAVYTLVIIFVCSLGWLAVHYRYNALTYKEQRDEFTIKLARANSTIDDLQTRQSDVNALDTKYFGELADAKAIIDQLELDVAAGNRRLRISAECRKNSAAAASSMDDDTGPRLTDAAVRDYFLLQRRIVTVTKQLQGLQSYVREQCIN